MLGWMRWHALDDRIVMNQPNYHFLQNVEAHQQYGEFRYRWVLFVLFQIHKITILRGQSPATPLGYRVGFALINALILGKIILMGEAFNFAEGFKNRPLVYAILFKSAA